MNNFGYTQSVHFLAIKKQIELIGAYLHQRDCEVAWSPCQHCIESGCKIQVFILESLSEGAWDRDSHEDNLSSANIWVVRENYLDIGG